MNLFECCKAKILLAATMSFYVCGQISDNIEIASQCAVKINLFNFEFFKLRYFIEVRIRYAAL